MGIDAFQLGASKVVVDLNLALGAGTDSTTAVVDFASSYDEDEYQALFDAFAGVDDEISPTELTAAFGAGHGVTTPVTTTRELIALLDAIWASSRKARCNSAIAASISTVSAWTSSFTASRLVNFATR